jgi:hypothetical protein
MGSRSSLSYSIDGLHVSFIRPFHKVFIVIRIKEMLRLGDLANMVGVWALAFTVFVKNSFSADAEFETA